MSTVKGVVNDVLTVGVIVIGENQYAPGKKYRDNFQKNPQALKKYIGKYVELTLDDNNIIINIEEFDPTKKNEKMLKHNIPKEFVTKLQGKEYITHEGLLLMAHNKGLKSIDTDMVNVFEDGTIVFKTVVTDSEGNFFTGYGDANDDNVNKMIAKHKIRMAETRSINRALRLMTGIGMCSVDELGGDEKQ
jgi:hypothetical protein